MRALLVSLALVVVASPRIAAADDVGVLVLGDILQKPTRDAAEQWLRDHNQFPRGTSLPNDAIKTLQDCFVVDDQRCSTSVIDARATTDNILSIRVEIASKKSKDVRLTMDWFVKKHAPISARRTCENCSEASLKTTVEAMLLELAKNKPGSMGHLKLTSDPVGIPAMCDNETVGVTPVDRDVTVGAHKCRLIRDGRMGPEKVVEVKADAPAEVALDAPPDAPAGPAEVPAGPVHHSRVLPGIMIGTGAAAVAAGAVMYFVLHKEPTVNDYDYTNWRKPGMITAGAGAAVALTGVIIILATPNHSAPTVSPNAEGGATISWSGRF